MMVQIGTAQKQDKQSKQAKKEAAVQKLIESQRYVFKAQSVMPMGAVARQLNYDYDMKVTKDTIDTYLPYFGRAYQAPIDPSQGGIKFVSKDFDYTITPGKKQGWEIVIKPNDANDVQVLNLSITSAGYAILQVTSNNRQPISFSGVIDEVKSRKKK